MPAPKPAPSHHCCIYIDGSSLPNPGPMSLGVVLRMPDGTQHTLSKALHQSGCNNEAELLALMAALNLARELSATCLTIRTDSSVLLEQLGPPTAKPARPIARLSYLFDEARQQMQGFDELVLQWIPRHRNTEADALARAAHTQL
ncbi:ribonuclease HI family protein [Comamonas sp. Y33R10-2]|uniref:ribonuclease HI family protein n=1 Tax=Comamonas sp. Y33R10-2 TaxID=2853257 RepID=UPI0021052AF4|nr:ribonuclease HI family protein [Comamonas sp. Y33R10-2]